MPLPGPLDHGSSPPPTLSLVYSKVVKNWFFDPTKVKKVGIVKGKTSQMIIKEKLSERAVMKEDRLG